MVNINSLVDKIKGEIEKCKSNGHFIYTSGDMPPKVAHSVQKHLENDGFDVRSEPRMSAPNPPREREPVARLIVSWD